MWSVALGGLTAVVIIAIAWLIARVVTDRFADSGIGSLAVAIAVAYLLRAAAVWASGVVSERASIRVKHELRDEVVADLLDPRRLGERPQSARLITLLGPGMDAFDGYIGRFLPQLALAVIVPVATIAAICWYDWVSALIIVVTLPLIGVFMALIGWLTQERVDRRWAAMERLGRHFGDVLDGLVVLKVFGQREEKTLRDVGRRHQNESMAALRMAFLSSLALELISTISVALVAVSIGLRVVDGRMELFAAMVVLLLAPEAYLPVRRVGSMFHDSAEGATATAQILDLLDHGRHTGTLPAPVGPAPLSLTGVVVRHKDRTRPSLDLERLDVQPGEFVAVTGGSGGGKSTLLSVLLGFEAPVEGSVTVAGVSLADVDIESWRRQVAWVPQLPGVVSGTVGSNVLLGCPQADADDVARALADAGLADMPADRVVAESAQDLSAGERRRLAIARALVRVRVGGAWLMLLDEPTAGLDPEREAAVLSTLRDLSVTVVVVAHRVDTMEAADRVVEIAPAVNTVGVG